MSALAAAREAFALTRAEANARAYTAAQAEAVRALVRAAQRRRNGAATRWSAFAQPAGVALAREALALYVRAAEVARDAGVDPAEVDPAAALERLAAEGRATDDWQLARAALASRDPLFLDRLAPGALAATGAALDACARSIARTIETRSVTAVRATRWGRIAAVAVLALYCAFAVFRATRPVQNIALGKKVYISSSHPHSKADAQTLVDGRTVRAWAFHTLDEDGPWVAIDLEEPHALVQIRVHNRADGWLEGDLPLALELSIDGGKYVEVARREEIFEPGHPWEIDVRGHRARYVRLRTLRRSGLALAAVEVYGFR